MAEISAVNYILLALVLAGALASLGRGLIVHWKRIGHGKAFFGPRIDCASVRDKLNWPAFVSRAVFTSRLKDRRWSGIAHGMLFAGALVLIFGHAVYALSFVGVPVYQGWFGLIVMQLGREIAGILLFLGVLFFLLRRFFPPERLTARVTRPGFERMEALILLTVLAGYTSESFRLAVAPTGGAEFIGNTVGAFLHEHFDPDARLLGFTLVWWLHGLLGATFIALIAWTPMSHMLLGPVNSALANRRDGVNLPAVDFDAEEDADGNPVRFGAARLADLTQKNLLDASACLWCGRCHEVCPAAQTGKDLSPKKVMATCAEFIAGGRFDDDSLIEVLGREAIFNCTTCAACIQVCPVSNNPAEIILEFRRHHVMERSSMPDTMAAANRNLESRGHPFVGTGANAADWRNGLNVPIFEPGKTEYLLWIGCSVAYEPRAQEIARAMARLLDAAGLSWGVFEKSGCTGDPAKMMGNEMQFVEMAQANIDEFHEQRVQKVITMCAHCFNSFDRYYPELGADWQTIPHTVLLDELIADGRLRIASRSDQKITFHDPCYLGRHNGIVEQPRRVLAAIGELIEMPRAREQSFCCGAGGGNYWGGQGGTARISDVRTQEAMDTGADRIATSCSFCTLMLTASAGKHSETRKVYDVAELVAERIRIVES
ncbi:MAG: putative iron-sulfur-binding oxidoreductase FadF [Pseudomonadales bacterium]|nr:putative iron-sulfur-binding oxidoreductase FadF [Pseudomonadales bacterium]